ncbi:hypothetical protein [Actinoplanes sp. NPDC026619]|uniref:hypothetical protein n=1 Tax=Actinoplanes sp. NPDC026619 TaxID=3155798 RepID=UPI0033C0B910
MAGSGDHSDALAATDGLSATASFGTWLDEFDPATVQLNGWIGRSIAWAYQHRRAESSWLKILALAILHLRYLFVERPTIETLRSARAVPERSPSVDQLIQGALEKTQAASASSADSDSPSSNDVGDTKSTYVGERSPQLELHVNDRLPEPKPTGMNSARLDVDASATYGTSASDAGRPTLTKDQGATFLERLQSDVADAARLAQRDAETLRRRETVVFRAMLGAGISTFALVVLGVMLALAGLVAVAVISAAVAILPGTGTAIFRNVGAALREQRSERSRAAADDKRVLQAVHAAMAIPEVAARNAALSSLAENFAKRAMEKAEQ